ncbi:MAG: hypothetical protein R3F17_02690 [Planctomycetota bacterium]
MARSSEFRLRARPTPSRDRCDRRNLTPLRPGSYTIQELGKLPGDVGSIALGINNLGDVVGTSNGSTFRKGVLFTAPGGILDLSPTGAFDPSDNDARQVACYHVGGARLDLNTMVLLDLGVPAGSDSNALGGYINASGQVAGYAVLATSGNCVYQAARYTDGIGWEVYGTCGPNNAAGSINAFGDLTRFQNTVGVVHLEGIGDYGINALLDPASGPWALGTLVTGKINDQRQIAAFANNSATGQSGIVLLTPHWDLGTPFCTGGFTNSTGGIATLTAAPTLAGSGLHLDVLGGPAGELGYLLVGTAANPAPTVPLGQGMLCLGTSSGNEIARYNVGTGAQQSLGMFNSSGVLVRVFGANGSGFDVPLQTGLNTVPTISTGTTLHFQGWFRDTPAGVGHSNASTALSYTF